MSDDETATPPAPTEDAALDVRPELLAWFHESEEICEHDAGHPWPCEVMADHLLRAFTVEPRLTEHKDGTFSYERGHFGRLIRADDLAEMDRDAARVSAPKESSLTAEYPITEGPRDFGQQVVSNAEGERIARRAIAEEVSKIQSLGYYPSGGLDRATVLNTILGEQDAS